MMPLLKFFGTPTPRASATPTAVRFVEVPETDEEVENALLELPPEDEETVEAREIIAQAKALEKQGRWQEARILWGKAREKVTALLARTRQNKASFNYWVAGLAALALVGGALYYSSSLNKPKPPAEGMPSPETPVDAPPEFEYPISGEDWRSP